ncbi:MAG: PadR family transcriptional regulator [Bacteroidales bacterium]|jgi:DNA-binding PadR family transcriptional regulator|nr:PadR family transcriptional regulator [Bacteroidales bacterium]
MNKSENIALTEAVYYILLALHQPLHGYGIMQETQKLTKGRLSLSAGTLYGALSALMEKSWIKALESEEESRKKEYIITELGKSVFKAELDRLQELVQNGIIVITQ